MQCKYGCHREVHPERIKLGYEHCTDRLCVTRWRQDRVLSENLALVLVPKSGFTIVYRSAVAGTGKSSGRG